MDALSQAYALIAFLVVSLCACAVAIRSSSRWGTLATALLAAGCNGYLFSRKWESAAESASVCNVSATINCDVINTSAWSEAFGLPITLLGLGFYVGLALATLFAWKSDDRFAQTNLAFAILNSLYSVFLAAQSAQIGAVCVLCITIYACNALLIWAGWRGLREEGRRLFDDFYGVISGKAFFTIATVFFLAVIGGGMAWRGQKAGGGGTAAPVIADGAQATEAQLRPLIEQPGGTVTLDGTEPVMGDPKAPYLIVEWADFGCPHCADAARDLKKLLAARKDVQVRFKVFPLTRSCNPALPHDGGPERCFAAAAAECAHQQGRFADMYHALFENQGYFAPDDLRFMAEQIRLDVPAFEQCMADPKTLEGVVRDADAGVRAGVAGTPSFFLKGTHGDAWVFVNGRVDSVETVIEAHAAGAPMPPPGPPSHGP